ncbi:hypothetical protein NC651_006873 [Populus alba x Populus x berolinensis]|nr:hypothetical protein NC651_006873 [Populus alba x Populus x berolinensis]
MATEKADVEVSDTNDDNIQNTSTQTSVNSETPTSAVPRFGKALAHRALYGSSSRHGGSRKARSSDVKTLPSRLSKSRSQDHQIPFKEKLSVATLAPSLPSMKAILKTRIHQYSVSAVSINAYNTERQYRFLLCIQTGLQQQWLTRQMHGNRHHHPFEFHDLAVAKHSVVIVSPLLTGVDKGQASVKCLKKPLCMKFENDK